MLPALIGLTGRRGCASAAGYQSMAPTGQWFGETFAGGIARKQANRADLRRRAERSAHVLKLLEVLAKHDVRATFFMIGRYVQQRPDIARAVAEAGHVIGNHTITRILCSSSNRRAETRAELVNCRSSFAR